MAFATWSVVFGEQPSAAKWNILGTNDEALRDGSGLSITTANCIPALALATDAITLGYASITSNATATTPVTQVAGLTLTVTIPSGGRRVKVTAYTPSVFNSATSVNTQVSIWDGAVSSGTRLQAATVSSNVATAQSPINCVAITSPAAGSKTYNVGLEGLGGGTATMSASATAPAYLLVEVI